MANRKDPRVRFSAVLCGLMGPGLLAAMADNDAGGVISYVVTGAKFGPGLFLPLTLCMGFLTYTVQEMAMRLGVVNSSGYPRLVRERYGKFWMYCQIVSLFAENLLTLLTEFIGMSAGLSFLKIPLWVSVPFSAFLVLAAAFGGGEKRKEKLALVVGLFSLTFLLSAALTRPDPAALGDAFLRWGVPEREQGCVPWYSAALVGNAIAPWMIFYQNGAYLDRNARKEEIRRGKADTMRGCVCQVAAAILLIVLGISLFGKLPDPENAGAARLMGALRDCFGVWPALLFGLALFCAGFLAAITVSLSSAWSVAEAFGWSKSRSDSVRAAPGFYAVYAGSVLLSAGAVLLPGLPVNGLSVLVQVLGGALMTPVLLFLTLLTGDREIMGEYRSTRGQRIRAWIVVALLSLASLLAAAEGLQKGSFLS